MVAQVTHELASHNDLQAVAHKQRLPLYSADQVYASLVQENPVKKPGMEPPEWLEAQLAMLKQYQVDLN